MLSFLHHPKTNAASFNPKSNRRLKYVLILLLPFFVILAQAPFVAVQGQKIIPVFIYVISVSPFSICHSTTDSSIVAVRFYSNRSDGAVFTAQLSNSAGNFPTDPTEIGTIKGATGGLIVAKIPPNLAPGTGYRIRIVTANPTITSLNQPQLVINSTAAPTLTLSKQDVSGCNGGSDGKITGVVNNGSGPYTFDVFHQDLTVTPAPGGTASNLPPGNYAMRVRDNGTGCVVSQLVTLLQVAAPTIEVSTQGNVSSCGTGGGFFTLRVFPRTGTTATAIKPFSFQEVPQGTDTTGVAYVTKPVPVIFDNLAAGPYMVTMKDGAGCKSTNTINNIVIGIDAPLAIALSGYGNPTSCTGTDGDITVLNTGGSGSTYRYSISKDGGTFSTPQSGRRFGGLGAGTYTIKGMDSRGCAATLVKTLNNPKGCTVIAGSMDAFSITAKDALKLQVFPNPAKTTFTLNLQGNNRESIQIVVTDMVGKKIYQTTGSSNRQYIFGQEFKSGIYIVQVIQGKQIQTLKLVKTN